LEDLSRYSFPPTHFEDTIYQQTPTIDTTSSEMTLEPGPSASLSTNEKSQVMDQFVDKNPITEDDDSDKDEGEDFNSSDQNISTWISLTTTHTQDSIQQIGDKTGIIEKDNHDDTLDDGSVGTREDCSEDNDNDIVVGTVDCIIETDEANTTNIAEATHTHTFVKTTNTSLATPHLPDPTTSERIVSSPPPPTLLTPTVPLSASALSMVSSLRDKAPISEISTSDDDNTTFLSAVDGTLTPTGSSSISSTVEWHTAGSTTPIRDDNDSNCGSEQEHDATVSLLELGVDDMVSRCTDTATSRITTTIPPFATVSLSLAPTLHPTTSPSFEESSGPSITTTTYSTSNTSNNYSFQEVSPLDYETIYISDSLSVDSERTETGSN
jgi:hypothetical protein